ncbi:TrmH family RNA methyltransferase [Schaalia odontolytica]|uniref:23S rRNA (Guanosine-2'-O-)-methyltransferase RlmB n=1 Tax=Schaalia odontolytica TaxID=1660 RepID=A0A2X0VPY5_9ACTO|nr:RNA methyltransferase [Schaalia odontolytica]WMS27196.1 RNA methyltransferase [Schaalia odontolytica]SPT55992.1 23S rRNA (guanosine-2'-O-)-methyltransferase RlmB [Schaalia odontolytica]
MSSFAERLTVLDNPRADRVRRVSGLVGRSARSRSGLMLVEGPQAVRELAAHRPDAVRDVYVREDAWQTHADVVDAARRATRWVHPVTAEVSTAMSGDSQGICAVASVDAISRELPEPSVGETIVVIAQGRDPGNVGTIIRTADAFGAVGVVVVAGTVDASSPKVVRSSAGSVFHIPVCVVASFTDARTLVHVRSAALLGTSGGAGSLSLSDLLVQGLSARSRLSQSHAWVFGNEARGLSGEEMRLCDALVSIPMAGEAESLNVASAAATCLFASQTVRGVGN